MVVAFDFDNTLDNPRLQRLARKFISEKNEVWVVTMRRDNEYNNKIIKPILDKCGLSKYNVIFSDDKPKFQYLKGINADLYIDNINDEFPELFNQTNAIPLLWSSQF